MLQKLQAEHLSAAKKKQKKRYILENFPIQLFSINQIVNNLPQIKSILIVHIYQITAIVVIMIFRIEAAARV